MLAGLVGLALGACGKDEPAGTDGGDGSSTPLKVEQIIASPKTAAAGDTLVMTADVRSSSANTGDIPTLSWTATGGTFVEDDQLTVRWVAPATSDIYVITARATNSVGSATGTADVLVAGESAAVLDDAGAVRLIAGGPTFYYQRTTNLSQGIDMYGFSGVSSFDAAPPAAANQFDAVFAPDLSFEAYWADTLYTGPASRPNRPRHIYVGRFAGGTFQRLSVDNSIPESELRQQFTQPAISANAHLVAFQGWLPDRFNAAKDSFEVFVYDLVQNTRVRVTAGQRYKRNFFPTFSTDQNWLTFVADTSGSSRWEIYGAHMSGDVVDADYTHFVKLSSTGGSIVSGSPAQVKPPMKQWNPVASELAVVAKDGTLYLIQTSASGGTTADVTGLPGTALEMLWSPDGSELAVVETAPGFGGAIYLVTGGSAAPLFTVPTGDAIRDLVWSPDGEWMVYRRTRGAASWFELLDLDASQLAAPMAITGAWPTGNVVSYRSSMSMSAAWGSGNQLWMPVFGVTPTSAEPGIITVNISGAVD
jgi:WD40-like Beta Propeller Repeat